MSLAPFAAMRFGQQQKALCDGHLPVFGYTSHAEMAVHSCSQSTEKTCRSDNMPLNRTSRAPSG